MPVLLIAFQLMSSNKLAQGLGEWEGGLIIFTVCSVTMTRILNNLGFWSYPVKSVSSKLETSFLFFIYFP